MPTNRDLFKQIKTSIDKDPEAIKKIQADDIANLICFELNEIKQLYDPLQFSEIQEKILEYTRLLIESVDAQDYIHASRTLDILFELHDMMPSIEITLPFIENSNYARALNRHILEGTIIVMGDSHTCFFSGNEDLARIPIKNGISTCNQKNDMPFTVLHLGPCLAYNSDRYGSKNQVREKIEWLDKHFLLQNDTIIISLGEIDIRTHVFKYSDSDTYKESVDEIISHYKELLFWLKDRGYNVICYGPIGSLKDSVSPDEYRPKTGSEEQRNMAGRYFNKELNKLCDENGLKFFTLFYDMVNDDNITDARFLSDDDLHLGQYGYQLAMDKLTKLGLEL